MSATPSQNSVAPLADIFGEPPGYIDSLLNRWLALVRGHPVPLHLIVALAITSSADAVLLLTRFSLPALIESLIVELLVVVVSLSIPVALTIAALRHEFRMIFSLVADGPSPAAPVLLRFVSEELVGLQELVGDLRKHGAFVDQAGVSEWVRRRCFVATKGRYLAVDKWPPSVFLARYRGLMAAHADFVARTGQRDSVRICVASHEEIVADRMANPEAFAEYVHWHHKHGIALLYLDRSAACAVAGRCKLGNLIDWSLWLGEVALSWSYEDTRLRMSLSFVGDHTYRRAYTFIRDALQASSDFAETFEDNSTAIP